MSEEIIKNTEVKPEKPKVNWCSPEALDLISKATIEKISEMREMIEVYASNKEKMDKLNLILETRADQIKVQEFTEKQHIALHEDDLKEVYGKMNDSIRAMEYEKRKNQNQILLNLEADVFATKREKEILEREQANLWMKIDFRKTAVSGYNTVSSNIKFFLREFRDLNLKEELPTNHIGV